MTRLSLLVLILLAACTSSEISLQESEASTLVSLTRLPPLPFEPPSGKLRLVFTLGVRPNGTVSVVRLLTPTRFQDWNIGAIDSVSQWRYAPLSGDSIPPIRWIRSVVTVRIEEPVLMDIGLLRAPTRAVADSLYILLINGKRFDSLAQAIQYENPNDWYMRSIDLSQFPEHVRDAVSRLEPQEFTRPLMLGTTFVIIKRYSTSERLRPHY